MRKRELKSGLEEEEEEETARRVRFHRDFDVMEDEHDVVSDSFDLDSASELSLLNSLVVEVSKGRRRLGQTEMQEERNMEEGEEKDKHVAAEKEEEVSLRGSSCPNLPRNSQVLFSRSLEPATTLGIDEELDIVWSAWNAWRQKDIEALDCILAAACEILLKNPFSPSRYHYISCAYISKKMPEAFSFPKTYKMLLKLLSSTTSPPLTNRPNLSAIFASKLLLRGFVGESEWHFEFIEVYLRDVVGPCAWTDHESCAEFVANLLTAFQDLTVIPGNRYSSDEMRKMVRSEYFKVLSQVLGADSTKENPQSLLKLLLIGVEYEDARLIASGMLEDWINNPVHMHSAKALLDCVVKKTHSMSKSDISTVGNLFLLQIKNQHSNIYSNMVCQLVCQRRDYATVALKTLVLLELHATNILNLKRMSTVLRAISGSPPPEWELALILQELAVSDDTRMKLRDFVCRMVRHIGSDINIKDLCHGLLQPWAAMADQNESLKVAWLTEIVELVTTLLLYSTGAFAMDESIMVIVSPPETATFPTSTVANIMASATKEKLEALEKFSLDLAVFQLEAMAWCTDVVAVYVPNMNKVQFTNILGQFLFLGDAESYFPKGEYFGEFACNSLQLISSCTRASEETLARLILLGISEKYPLTMGDALSIIESLVWRAGAFHRHFRGSLLAESKQLPAAVFKLASFSLPGIAEQSLSDIVYKDKYWRACLVVLLLAVYNPGTIGQYAWENNVTVRYMMERAITGSRDVSPKKMKLNDLESEEMLCDAKAEESICSVLSDANRTISVEMLQNINEWKGNVMLLNQSELVRRPPGSIIEELDQADKIYQLGCELRECRHPDFFAQITGLQTLPKAWSWLRRILPQEPQLVSVLPLSWQCELLYLQEGLVARGRKLFVDIQLLYLSLCKVITDTTCEKEVKAVVEYLFCKLADKCSVLRSQARCCLTGLFNTLLAFWEVLSSSGDGGHSNIARSKSVVQGCDLPTGEILRRVTKRTLQIPDHCDLRWLEGIQSLPNANVILSSLLPAIRAAVKVETSVEVVGLYLKFLEKHSPRLPSLLSAAGTIASLLVERKDFAACLVLGAKQNGLHMLCSSSSVVTGHMYIVDLILNSLCEALRVGTCSLLNEEQAAGIRSPLVTIVSPQYDDRGTENLLYITLHKIILDAVLGVLSLWFTRENADERKDSVEKMVQILVPYVAGKTSIAWLDSGTGQRLPLLSEEQAKSFSRSTNGRIASADNKRTVGTLGARFVEKVTVPSWILPTTLEEYVTLCRPKDFC